ncbi:MAG: hypothetical protein IJ802_01590, partial [Kiritimatiellae bacterium]|nr:hypothetical protein [Kiritimatiellia bacterium]
SVLGAFINVSMQIVLVKWAATPEEGTREIAALGVFQATLVWFFTMAMGVQQAMAPIIGYNWGARNYGRVRRAVVAGFWITTAIVGFAAATLTLAPGVWTRLFMSDADAALAAASNKALVWSNILLWVIGLNITATTFFQAIGHPRTAIILSTLRQGVCFLPCIWILPYFFEDHALGVWLACPASDILAFAATLPVAYTYLRFLSRVKSRK